MSFRSTFVSKPFSTVEDLLPGDQRDPAARTGEVQSVPTCTAWVATPSTNVTNVCVCSFSVNVTPFPVDVPTLL